ncbi:putative porin [Leptospira langatensis]|uniref:Porin n=1 Tax=Leptospira langatensis TaxID=2484983 RepID=A0A5F1ZPU2_9LEPT|nr:putative porin [Leptospira langatensis]TGK01972.1 putative porin [Leptospira langatensis]TGL39330.1 putative porin [Leptospira langatensis]
MKILIRFLLLSIFLVHLQNIQAQDKGPPLILKTESDQKNETTPSSGGNIPSFLKDFLSRSSLTGLFGQNGGQHIFESGTKYPNLSGVKAGSRITYDREFQYGGLEFKHWWNGWEISLGYRSNFKNQRTEQGRDEDFFMGSVTQERGTKIDLGHLSFYDTPYTFTGTQNFADGRGKLKMKQDRISLQARKYFGTSDPDPRKAGSGIFLSGGAHYSFFKYYLYDVTQWIATVPIVTYGPIGIGLSYSNSTWEFPFGIGYRYSTGNWMLETGFMGSVWYSHYRDYHYQRNLNFIGDSSGYGIETHIAGAYVLNSWMFLLKLTEYRLYGQGSFQTHGGLNTSDILSNFSGEYRNYLSTKQFAVELQITNFLDWISR